MPFFDHGGIIADNQNCEKNLLQAAIALGNKLKVQRIELRHLDKIASLEESCSTDLQNEEVLAVEGDSHNSVCTPWSLRSHKVQLLLPLPSSSETLLKSFKSKLRSQINRPIRAGLTVKIGNTELLDDFYTVFSTNMRDLGSPVHGKLLIQCVLEKFHDLAKIVLVYREDDPLAAALMVGFKDVMINPWASSLRQYSKESPNMLLYWSMMAYAADRGYRHFDFGRSTPGEGTYRFKIQWGAQPHPMYWYTLWLDRSKPTKAVNDDSPESKKRALATKLWQKLPVPLSRVIGPLIRKHIDL
jgi:FemAB-related protein (PEP-CTERM system-associated)